jgi:hypothetical protein
MKMMISKTILQPNKGCEQYICEFFIDGLDIPYNISFSPSEDGHCVGQIQDNLIVDSFMQFEPNKTLVR